MRSWGCWSISGDRKNYCGSKVPSVYSAGLILLSVFIYGVVHSLLASLAVKERIRLACGPITNRWYRLVYNVFAGVSFLPVLALPVLLPDGELYTVHLPWLTFFLLGQLLAVIALLIGLWQTGIWMFLGLQQLVTPASGEQEELVIVGLYRWVRHPLYTAGLAFIWLVPVMTLNLLALNIGLTIYLILGAIYEERKLLRVYGAAYAEYQKRTPMLIPLLVWRRG
jgi:protein-S-isoprenylcysteine O-methyltransferase Ste14